MVAYVALEFRVGVKPLLSCFPEKSDIKYIGFVGIGDSCLSRCDLRRNEMLLDGICVNAVIKLRKGAVEVPCKLKAAVFVFFNPLELLDEVEFEFDGYPGSEL
ncbi:MAG: hypothetical protein PHT13_03105 [Methanosarcina sp.]|nr:hypothetical protein [Methanosarcina sp.]